jgi:FixJ family two-component response regulator
MTSSTELAGLAVLVVEDDYYLADDTQRTLEAAGALVAGPYARVAESLSRLAEGRIDCGVLDVNLGEGPSFATARALKRQRVPFVFLTGYGREALPEDFDDVELLEKPVDSRALIDAVARACAKASLTGM